MSRSLTPEECIDKTQQAGIMLLAIDIGNTHTVIGMHDGSRWVGEWRLSSGFRRTRDETWFYLRGFIEEAGVASRPIKTIGISSVVPDLTDDFITLSRDRFGIEPLIVTSDMPELQVRVDVREPLSVGADRLCNAVAGFAMFGGPLLVVDFGTATTIDVIGKQGEYLGGAILLGVESQAAELHRRAAKLPKFDLRFPPTAIGKDTVASMQSGVLFGSADGIEGMVKRMKRELQQEVRVIATGGLSTIIAPHCPSISATVPLLVLDGIRILCERHMSTNRSPETAGR
jgi:type III pantothenate kinase